MNKIDLDKIIAITDKATKGPWTSYREGRDFTSGSSFIMTGKDGDRDYDMESYAFREEDQDFIAMARNVIHDLVSEIIRLQKLLDSNNMEF